MRDPDADAIGLRLADGLLAMMIGELLPALPAKAMVAKLSSGLFKLGLSADEVVRVFEVVDRRLAEIAGSMVPGGIT